MNQQLVQEKDPPRKKYNGRYASGTLVLIPDWLPSALRRYRRETSMTPQAIAKRVPEDHNGIKVSAHAISNLMNNDLDTKKTQVKVGATLLGHLTTIIRSQNTVTSVKSAEILNVSELVTSYAGLTDEDRMTITILINRLQPANAVDPRVEAVEKLMDMAARIEGDINKGATC